MPRTATTFLYQRFQEHPSVFCPYRKETNFFSVNYEKGLDWYRDLYAGMEATQVGADVSPAYFLDEQAIDRILAYNPSVPVILGVRKASDWALSWYTQVLTGNVGTKPEFEEFVTAYAFEISGGTIWQDFRNGFVQRMVERYREAFGDNLFLYDYRILREDPLALINGIEQFIGVPTYFTEENLKNEIVNAGARRNIGLLAWLLSREKFVDFVGRLVPRKVVQSARNVYVGLGTTQKKAPKPTFSEEELALSARIFAEDDAWIDSLFSDSKILTGKT